MTREEFILWMNNAKRGERCCYAEWNGGTTAIHKRLGMFPQKTLEEAWKAAQDGQVMLFQKRVAEDHYKYIAVRSTSKLVRAIALYVQDYERRAEGYR